MNFSMKTFFQANLNSIPILVQIHTYKSGIFTKLTVLFLPLFFLFLPLQKRTFSEKLHAVNKRSGSEVHTYMCIVMEAFCCFIGQLQKRHRIVTQLVVRGIFGKIITN
jgi:hypothetical protein